MTATLSKKDLKLVQTAATLHAWADILLSDLKEQQADPLDVRWELAQAIKKVSVDLWKLTEDEQ